MSTNVSVLCGRLTADPVLRKTTTNVSVVSCTLAVDRNYKKDNQPTVDFIGIQAWNQSAEYLGKYAKKGTMINVTGRVQTHNYDDKDGKKVYVTEIVADYVQIVNSQSKNQANDDNEFATIPETNQHDVTNEEAF